MLALVAYSVGKLYTSSRRYCCPPNWEKVPGRRRRHKSARKRQGTSNPSTLRRDQQSAQAVSLVTSEPGLGGTGRTGKVLHLCV